MIGSFGAFSGVRPKKSSSILIIELSGSRSCGSRRESPSLVVKEIVAVSSPSFETTALELKIVLRCRSDLAR
jgi:hypothetical protein